MSSDSPCTYLLRVSFYADQISNDLVWAVEQDDPVYPNALRKRGKAAGTLSFQRYDILAFEVVGYGLADTFETFEVTDCTLITKPAAYVRPLIAPSPFDCEHATFDLDRFQPTNNGCGPVQTDEGLMRNCTAVCAQAQVVTQESGYWEFAMMLTVKLTRIKAEGQRYHEVRVFSFDPDVSVGSDKAG